MAKAKTLGRRVSQIGQVIAVAASAILASCVPTVTYRSLPSSFESAQRALTAEHALTHPQTVASRTRNPDTAPLSFCTSDGLLVEIPKPQVTENGICGQRVHLLPTAVSATVDPERCWSYAEISSIGQPKDATTIGYYAVRGYLRCPNG
ncbi:hypothetical protein [uncultured Brevundimonas sp.]|uniref:hypothetical protein n=1 Tax=uncultured Brevundimonas sp. TaxID=213418 RepID=UPI0025DB6E12|nr:hypothetical protein [uncultured Brevundimonas sp.]